MINFIKKGDGTLSFEVNRANIINRDISIKDELLLLGGTEVDVAELYMSMKSDLQVRQEEINSLSREIKEISNDIEEKRVELNRKLKEIELRDETIKKQKIDIEKQKIETGLIKERLEKKREELYRHIEKIEDQKIEIERQSLEIVKNREEMSLREAELKSKIDQIESRKRDLELQSRRLKYVVDEIERTQKELKDLNIEIAKNRNTIKNQNNTIGILAVVSFIILILSIWITLNYRSINLAKKLIERQYQELETLNRDMKSSIEYALLIQKTALPDKKILGEYFSKSFVLWQPRDTVGGDIYFIEAVDKDRVLLFIIDCTGHGVPGAFVTMLVKAIKRQIIEEYVRKTDLIDTSSILEEFDSKMRETMHQLGKRETPEVGFEGAVVLYDKSLNSVQYSGASTPLFIHRKDGEIEMLKGDKGSIGYSKGRKKITENRVDVESGDSIYLTTDGYLDQVGSDKDSKKRLSFGKKRFKNLISELKDIDFDRQPEIFDKRLREYEKDRSLRRDDVTVMGLKL
jgi:serine phosphatase RsbU (regulator of sigma subunit)